MFLKVVVTTPIRSEKLQTPAYKLFPVLFVTRVKEIKSIYILVFRFYPDRRSTLYIFFQQFFPFLLVSVEKRNVLQRFTTTVDKTPLKINFLA